LYTRRPVYNDGVQVEVFAVEDTSVQVCWGNATGVVDVAARWSRGSVTRSVVTDGGPGATVLDGLPPSTTVEIGIAGMGVRRTVTTLAPPARSRPQPLRHHQ
jgi:hypothetical protein